MAVAKKQPAKKSASSGVFDVSAPGRSGIATNSNTKHVIITNRPVIKDPMVNDTVVIDDKPAVAVTAKHAKVIAPVAASESVTSRPVQIESPKVDDGITEADKAKPIGELADDPPAGIPDSENLAELQRVAEERVERLQKLIDEEAYFLPINAVEQRRSRRVAVLGLILILLLAAVWYNVALDAGLLPNSYNLPHTHFFSTNQ